MCQENRLFLIRCDYLVSNLLIFVERDIADKVINDIIKLQKKKGIKENEKNCIFIINYCFAFWFIQF